jgi:hypothetical protein
MPEGFAEESITVRIAWAADTATSGSVVWGAAFERNNDEDDNADLDTDSFDVENTATSGAPATSAGKLQYANIVVADGERDGLLQGEQFRLKIRRIGTNGSDDMSGDAQIASILLSQDAAPINQLGGGVPTTDDKDLTPLAVTTDDGDTGITITAEPSGDGHIAVILNGFEYPVAANEAARTTSRFYFGTSPGTAKDIENVTTGDTLYYNALVAARNLSTSDRISLDYDIGAVGGGAGEVNTASNVGTGAEVYKQKTVADLELRSIIGGAGILATENALDITLDLDVNELAAETTFDLDQDAIPFYDQSNTDVRKALLRELPYVKVLATQASVALGSSATPTIYTVPAGKTALVTDVLLFITGSTPPTTPAQVGVDIDATVEALYTKRSLIGVLAVNDAYSFAAAGKKVLATAGQAVKLNVTAADQVQTATAVVLGMYI